MSVKPKERLLNDSNEDGIMLPLVPKREDRWFLACAWSSIEARMHCSPRRTLVQTLEKHAAILPLFSQIIHATACGACC